MISPVRPRGCGCLMLFSIFCLTVFTAAEVGGLLWLNPEWFDRQAFWRGPILPPDVVLVANPAAHAALDREDAERDAAATARTARADAPVLLEDLAVEADYDPVRGVTLTTKADGVFEFPSGSVRETAHIRVVPIASLPQRYADAALGVVGPVYQIFIGDQEHYQFARPIHVTLPYIPEMLGPKAKHENIKLYTFDGGWHAFPSTVDPQRHTVSGEVSHCSPTIAGTIDAAQDAGNWTGGFVNTVRQSAWFHFSFGGSKAYETPAQHFKIHYGRFFEAPLSDKGAKRLPPEIKPAKPNPDYPNSVVLLGEFLETSRDNLQTVNMPISGNSEYNVYLAASSGAFLTPAPLGDSPLTGDRLFITSAWYDDSPDAPPPPSADMLRHMMKATATHELLHVAQSQVFGSAMGRGRWWMEMTAPYLADRFWAQQGDPTNIVRDYYMGLGDLGHNCQQLTLSMDDSLESNDWYRYAAFLQWLEKKDAAGVLKVLDQVKKDQDFSVAALDKIFQREFKKPLGELLEAFAQDFYHLDLANNAILPPAVYMNSNETWANYQTKESREFLYAMRASTAKSDPSPAGIGVVNVWARTEVPALSHLTTSSFPVLFEVLPLNRKPKFVVQYEPAGAPDPDLSLTVATAQVVRKKTGVLRPVTPFVKVDIKAPQTKYVVGDASVLFDDNRATILLSNRSLDRKIAGGALERWVLLAPAWLQSDPASKSAGGAPPQGRKLTWHKTELKDAKAFKGYVVYRRKTGEPDSAFKPMAEVKDEKWTDDAGGEDNAYMVRVKDVLDNESADSPLDDHTDPFQGDWRGTITLVKGSLVEPILTVANKVGADMDKEESAAIAHTADPAERARRQKEWDETKKAGKETYDDLAQALRAGEQVARAGLPFHVAIAREDDRYFLLFPDFNAMATGTASKDGIPMMRSDQHTLQMADMPPESPPLLLRLWRVNSDGRNEIRSEYRVELPIDGKTEECVIKWDLFREAPQPAPGRPIAQLRPTQAPDAAAPRGAALRTAAVWQPDRVPILPPGEGARDINPMWRASRR